MQELFVLLLSPRLTSLLGRPLPVGAVPFLPRSVTPLGREVRYVPHAGALPDGLVADAHAEELDGPQGARARVVAVVAALRAPPRPVPDCCTAATPRDRPGARRRQRAVAHHRWWGWRLGLAVESFFLFLSYLSVGNFFWLWCIIWLGLGEKGECRRNK